MKTTYYKPIFVFNKKLPEVIKDIISREFMRLRPFAVESLNANYGKWNDEYDGPIASDNDPLKDYGGTAYCEYICQKSRMVLEKVNRNHPSAFVKLDVQEFGDIIARTKIGNVTMELELMPIEIGT